jgi:pimeloyl-ACP methyl ester carboxylesterase
MQIRGPIAFEESGSGPLAVFIHGYPLDHRLWLDQLDGLSDIRHCVAPDLPGFGASEPLDEFTMETVADSIATFIGNEQADIVALSMGGYIALALWERHPEAVRSLSLLDTKAGADTQQAREGRRAQAVQVAEQGTSSLVDGMTRALLAPGPEAVIAALRGMADRRDRVHVLATIDVPAAVVVGALDALTPPTVAVEMSTRIPGATVSVIPGAGHLTPIEAPEEVTGVLRHFLDH